MTPPFVVWSLEYECAYREEADPNDSERIERILRPLRASAEAVSEDRCHEGVCLHANVTAETPASEATGFRLDDTLIPFGGREQATLSCSNCPANVAIDSAAKARWAGCHGLLIIHSQPALEEQLQHCLQQLETEHGELERLPAATQVYYRLWQERALCSQSIRWHELLWDRVVINSSVIEGLPAFRSALAAARTQELTLHVSAYPAGERSSRHWHVPTYCGRCSAPRAVDSLRCSICLAANPAIPARRRLARGERPYWQLTRFLGVDEAARLLHRYAPNGEAS